MADSAYETYVEKLNAQQAKAQKAYDSSYNNYISSLNSQARQNSLAYDTARKNTKIAAAQSSAQSNDVIADLGLAKGLYTSPTSGYSESSRNKVTLAYQNELASLNTEERAAVQSLQEYIDKAQTQKISDDLELDNNYQESLVSASEADQERATSYYDNAVKNIQSGYDADEATKEWISKYYGEGAYDSLVAKTNSSLYKFNTSVSSMSENQSTVASNVKAALLRNGYTFNDLAAGATNRDKALSTIASGLSYYAGNGTITTDDVSSVLNAFGLTADEYKSGIETIVSSVNDAIAAATTEDEKIGYTVAMYNALGIDVGDSLPKQSDLDSNTLYKYYTDTLGIDINTEDIQDVLTAEANTKYLADGSTTYNVTDKSNNKAISDTSLSLGENILITSNNTSAKVKLERYATKAEREALSSTLTTVGQIVKYNGNYYLKGNGSIFMLHAKDISDGGLTDKFKGV